MSKDVVEHYKKKLLRNVEDSEKVLYCLKKLDQAPVTIDILQDTEVGKVVNRLKKNSDATSEVIEASKALVEKWKEFVKKSEETDSISENEAVKSKSKTPSEDKKSSKHHHKKDKKEKHKSHKHHKEKSSSSSHKSSHHEKSEKSAKKETESKASSSSAKSKESKSSSSNGHTQFDFLSTVPADINPNYKPKPRYEPPPRYTNGHHSTNNRLNNEDDDALSAMIAYSKSGRGRTAVYSGKKNTSFYSRDEPLPSLKDMCIRILQENVDQIDECGNLDYTVLKPVLERAKPDDLMRIEEYNPKLMDDTGELWEKIAKKRFPKHQREEMETYRELYERMIEEEKEKLDRLMGKVQNSYASIKTTNKQTKLFYDGEVPKPPRGVKRAQEKNGTFIPVGSSLDKVKKARLSKFGGGPSGNSGPGPSSRGDSAPKKPKVAPLMAKTFKMARGLKSGFRR